MLSSSSTLMQIQGKRNLMHHFMPIMLHFIEAISVKMKQVGVIQLSSHFAIISQFSLQHSTE